MAHYAIGDIHGCYEEFRALLSLIQFNPDIDKVYLVGDLVNRGPNSLEVLRYVMQYSNAIKLVLGNHDLHLLACWVGVVKTGGLDTLDDVLNAEDVDGLMHWLRQQPLLLTFEQFVITHAGLNPAINFDTLRDIAHICSNRLAGEDFIPWLKNMYGNSPAIWQADLNDTELFRFGINSLTRMRMLDGDKLELKFKAEPALAPKNLKPWFSHQRFDSIVSVFGHWSTLGLIVNNTIRALDTGCVWGGQLSAICLDNGDLFQIPAFSASIPLKE